MTTTILALILSLQMLLAGTPALSSPSDVSPLSLTPREQAEEHRLWWGLIDPELSAWFALTPAEDEPEDQRILWDWSWRGFLAAIFGTPVEKEAHTDAASV